MSKMWEQEGFHCAEPYLRGDIKEELSPFNGAFAEINPRDVLGHRSKEAAMQEYKNDKLVVRYDPAICIHAGECVRGLPSVFNLSRKPWIDVSGASAAAVIEQVKRCPSGALTYQPLNEAH
jgi:uncharacterized Fe-S cluster protein YjdI